MSIAIMTSAHGNLNVDAYAMTALLQVAAKGYTVHGIEYISALSLVSDQLVLDALPASVKTSDPSYKRWIKIQQALEDNDHERVRKKLTDQVIWLLGEAIDVSFDDVVTNQLTLIEELGSRTEKQEARLHEMISRAHSIEKNILNSRNWKAYVAGLGCLTATLFTAWTVKNRFSSIGKVTTAIAAMFGLGTYKAHQRKQDLKKQATTITNVLETHLTAGESTHD